MSHPIQIAVSQPTRFRRLQLLIRCVVFIVLGRLRLSVGSLFALAYVALPVYAAIRTASLGSSEDYAREDGPRLIKALNWFVAISAWAGLAAERLPAHRPDETVVLTIEGGSPRFNSGSVLLRILSGLPSLFALMILGCLGGLIWLWAAISILFSGRVEHRLWNYLVGLQRWSVRLLAFQAGLVDSYPPFSFDDEESGFSKTKAIPY